MNYKTKNPEIFGPAKAVFYRFRINSTSEDQMTRISYIKTLVVSSLLDYFITPPDHGFAFLSLFNCTTFYDFFHIFPYSFVNWLLG